MRSKVVAVSWSLGRGPRVGSTRGQGAHLVGDLTLVGARPKTRGCRVARGVCSQVLLPARTWNAFLLFDPVYCCKLLHARHDAAGRLISESVSSAP